MVDDFYTEFSTNDENHLEVFEDSFFLILNNLNLELLFLVTI